MRLDAAAVLVLVGISACGQPAAAPSRCDVQFAPTEPSLLLTYRRTGQLGGEAPVTFEEHVEVESSSASRVALRYEAAGSSTRFVRACEPSGMEDPYLGWVSAQGFDVSLAGRWPRDVRESRPWETSLLLVLPSQPALRQEARRHYEMVGEETATVPAGSFATVRVTFTESMGEYRVGGSLWLSRDIGLVRMQFQDDQSASVEEVLLRVEHVLE